MADFMQEFVGLDVNKAFELVSNDKRLGFRKVVKIANNEKYSGTTFEVVLMKYDPVTMKVTSIGSAYKG